VPLRSFANFPTSAEVFRYDAAAALPDDPEFPDIPEFPVFPELPEDPVEELDPDEQAAKDRLTANSETTAIFFMGFLSFDYYEFSLMRL
jgi:hypothetical protein